jgi:hypothetical protein
VIFEPERFPSNPKVWTDKEFEQYYDLESKETDKQIKLLKKIEKDNKKEMGPDYDPRSPIPEKQLVKLVRGTFTHLSRLSELRARRFSVQLSLSEQAYAHPILLSNMKSLKTSDTEKTEVIQIVLNALPVPDDSTPWEGILDYRSDPKSKKKISELRHWMNKFAEGKLTVTEAKDEIEYLLNEYEKHLRLHKIKTRTILMGVILQFGAAYLDKKVGPIATGIATYLLGQVGLLEGEAKAPGKEVAYLVDTKRKFS